MKFAKDYNCEGIGIDSFFYSGIATRLPVLSSDDAFRLNKAFFSANVMVRIGPALYPSGKLFPLYGEDKFSPGIYIPKEEFHKLHSQPNKEITFTTALNKLEKKLQETHSVKKQFSKAI